MWDAGDVFLNLGNKLQDKEVTERQRPEGKNSYEMSLYVECTEEEVGDIMEDITSILCRGHRDGTHHICINQTSVGMSRIPDEIYTEYEALENDDS
jgi:hypothetical protein